MAELETGGPAFPVLIRHAADGVDVFGNPLPPGHENQYVGMTLRDYFAAKAMQGLIVGRSVYPIEWAETAYELADAMLAARLK